MMKYDVYRKLGGECYLLDVQSHLMGNFNSRVVVPLYPVEKAPKPAKRLNPVFVVEGEQVVMLTQFLGTVHAPMLRKPVMNLSKHMVKITDALDMVFKNS